MNTREHLIECYRAEKPKFLRVMRAVPADQLDYRPHPRSSSAGVLVGLLASELNDQCVIVDRGELDFAIPPAPATLEDAIAAYERNARELEQRLERLDDEAWAQPARLVMDGKPWEVSLGEMLWAFLFDAIHHRGQLSTYLRPMGAKVPAIYGPSADDSGW